LDKGALVNRDPKDFEEKREEYYQKLGVPLSTDIFIEAIQEKMRQKLNQFDKECPKISSS